MEFSSWILKVFKVKQVFKVQQVFKVVSKENDYDSTPEQNDALLTELRNMFKLSRGLVTLRLRELEAQLTLPL